ncbi:MAG: insulinase family protein [Bacteroidales bacterium]|jgi:zinc protease|nr:insulinase family protein [Bacteroidales bacterium]MCK9498840.1 insulinase family protein [Bacteroidales bacterium]MDY0315645.1 insulinase family protein [Bacteroidales bacterium]
MKQFTFLIIAIIFSFNFAFGQGMELTDKLPNDPNVITGTLENGLTYYIKSNKIPENRAEFTLAVKAGSVIEDEDQQGLAHFTEHMAFNGSTNFPKNELVNYLESLGMQFGPEVNAYTSFDETVYGIKVPTDDPEFIEKGLLVLYDWASELSLETEEIDAERGVIHEEWRMGQGAMDRIQRKYLKAIFHNSIYAERLPIGTMEVVDNCDPETIRRFYRDWYRPDLMAVILVGDFDAKEMEQKVINQFSKIKMIDNPRERVYADIPDHEETLICVATDPEAPISMIQMFYKHPSKPKITVADYKDDMISMLLSSMLSNRLAELTLLENPPFIQAYAGYSEFIGPKDVFISLGIVQNNDIKTTMQALVSENERMIQYGFTETELEREKAAILKQMEKAYNERDKQKSESYVSEYKQHFLPPYSPYPGIEYEYELFKKYIPQISLEEVNAFAKTVVTEENCVIVVMAPEKEGVTIPSQDEILKIYQDASKIKVEAYVDKVSDKSLISDLPKPVKVSKKSKNKDFGYQTWTLKNGIKVVFKTTDFKDDEIMFEAKSLGGYSVYEQRDDISSKIADEVAEESGLGNYDKSELQKFLADKNVRFSTYIGESSEGITGSSSVEDFETLLQMIYATFTQPRLTETAFNSYMNKQKALLENAKLDPQSAWSDTLRTTVANNHPRRRPINATILDEANFRRVKSIYSQRFGDPGNFTFYFVGNFDEKLAKPLIEKYLGALPIVERNENYRDLGVRPPKGIVEKTVNKGKDAKCMEVINFTGEFDYTYHNRLELDAICKILSTRLLEEIREKESGVYTIGAYPSSSKIPYEQYSVTIFFSCDPERENELKTKIFDIVKSLQTDGISEKDIQKVIEKEKREFETNVKENSYWKRLIMDVEDKNVNSKEYKDYPNMMENISVESMTKAANKYFDLNNYIKVMLAPEN